jgi:hypothetical protein
MEFGIKKNTPMRLFPDALWRAVQIQILTLPLISARSRREREPLRHLALPANLHGCKTLVLVVMKKLRLKGAQLA